MALIKTGDIFNSEGFKNRLEFETQNYLDQKNLNNFS